MNAAEKVAEDIVGDLFTQVLDWSLADFNHQVGYADILLSRNYYKYLLIETKHPGSLAWNRKAVEKALGQARGYADKQNVNRIAVSDGGMLYAADLENGQMKDRVFVSLDVTEPPESLWWLSLHGIYASRNDTEDASIRLLPEMETEEPGHRAPAVDALLHPKYKAPAYCFAYVKDASDPKTWKLPYRLANGELDMSRLPKAIQAVLTNYRGVKVSTIPGHAIPDVLVTLGRAARSAGKMPGQTGDAAPVYVGLEQALRQFGRLGEVENG